VLRIRDVYPGSEFSHPGFRIRIKEFKNSNPKNWFLSSLGNMIRVVHPDPDTLPIPDPGSRGDKSTDPGSGFATLIPTLHLERNRQVLQI
jgi:hypothetical protein